ncbi:MAG: hypothetical protein M3O70_25630 [Actinomycetota bacterium]|nr:hypothetical protein [Actinomycetota bacterium]
MGMQSGDWTEAARQILGASPPGTEVWISDTVNSPHQGHVDGYHAVVRNDGSINLTKYHN